MIKFKPHWYNPKTQICSIETEKIKDKDDISNAACGQRDHHTKKEPIKQCCRKRLFNKKTGSTTLNAQLSDGVKTKCCHGREGSIIYSPTSQVCCKGTVHQKHLWQRFLTFLKSVNQFFTLISSI